jgi:peptide/nickel transport system ATP-binding protein
MSILEIEDLQTHYRSEGTQVDAIDGISLDIEANETIGLVGESGSGKSTLAQAILRILPDNGEITNGEIRYQDQNLLELSEKELRKRRWEEIAMIPQNAINGFDPVYTVGEQIVEVIRVHRPSVSKDAAWERAYEFFRNLGMDAERAHDYPHQYSGGMAQRAMIALALALEPSVVLADEPTNSLDVVMQDKTLQTIKELQSKVNAAIVLITHDMSVVSELCDRIAVMYDGRLVEVGRTEEVIQRPRHPYTQGLRNSFPDVHASKGDLIAIPDASKKVSDPEEMCRFAPRCPFAEEECWGFEPQPERYDGDRLVECHRADEAETLRQLATKPDTWEGVTNE